jgi:hypothetical protein
MGWVWYAGDVGAPAKKDAVLSLAWFAFTRG